MRDPVTSAAAREAYSSRNTEAGINCPVVSSAPKARQKGRHTLDQHGKDKQVGFVIESQAPGIVADARGEFFEQHTGTFAEGVAS